MGDKSEESVAHISIGLAVDQSVVQVLHHVVVNLAQTAQEVFITSLFLCKLIEKSSAKHFIVFIYIAVVWVG